jgi:hypothetical protein
MGRHEGMGRRTPIAAALTAVVLTGALAAPAAAQVADKLAQIVPAKVGAKACFARVYDAKHLAAHPKQRVTQMTFLMRVTGISDSGDWVLDPAQKYVRLNYQFAMSVMRRGARKAMSVSGYCPEDMHDVMCMRECDGGGVALAKIAGSNGLMIKVDQDGILLGGSCDVGEESWLKAGADDKAFALEPVAAVQCSGLEKEELDR